MQARVGNDGDEVVEGKGSRGRYGRGGGGGVGAAGQVRNGTMDTNDEDNMDASNKHLTEQVQALAAQVEEIERKVSEVTRMRSTARKSKGKVGGTAVKDREKGSVAPNKKQQQLDIARREAARSKRMQELLRQVGTILRQISQHKWAWPFMKPVDVEGLGLHDYHDVVENPMDLGTIRDKMDAKDFSGYKHVQEICDDIRLVFINAMTYNQEGSDVHVMAKSLSDKFEEKWKALLEPKLAEEEAKRRQEDKELQVKEAAATQAAEEIATENLAQQYALKLEELDKQLEELKQQATPKCSRAMSIEEKRNLGQNLGKLPPDNLSHVIKIIAEKNPTFNALADEVEVDIDAQDPATLWRLHRYVQAVLNPRTAWQVPSRNTSTKRVSSSPQNKKPSKRSRRPASP